MAASGSVLSQTLQSITVTKIEELATQRQAYEERKQNILNSVLPEKYDLQTRVLRLHDGVQELDLCPEDTLGKIERCVNQSRYDPSVPESTLLKFEDQLRSKLDLHSRKLDLADLYSRLLVEWTESSNKKAAEASKSPSEEGFDVVENIQKERLQHLQQEFGKVIFEPLETDEDEITDYLSFLFPGKEGARLLENLRERIGRAGKSLLAGKAPIELPELKRCIQSLLKNDMLDDEKAATLRDFLRDDTVLGEIRDVLNMRYASLKNWSWNLGSKGVPVRPRQGLNGKWRVVMDEDVLQALLTHWIGSKWVASLKSILYLIMNDTGIWTSDGLMPPEEIKKQDYYLGLSRSNRRSRYSVQRRRHANFWGNFFMSPLPSKPFEDAVGYEEDYDIDPDHDDDDTEKLSPTDVKQHLLRTLATELIVKRSTDGEVAIVQSDFQWFGAGLAHSTIFACLRFAGFQDDWIEFFKKALEPPMDMLTGDPVRVRKRGLPIGHVLAKLIGELVLFFMDLAVNKKAEMLLYRLHDDLWLCGEPDKCAKAWTEMQSFAKIMGLQFNDRKTGSVYLTDKKPKDSTVMKTLPNGPVEMNFLVLDPTTGQWVINKAYVKQHVEQLQKQLAECSDVLSWVRTWNSCIGRFFSHTFGAPANCFGRAHLDAIRETHKQIQQVIFDGKGDNGKSVTEHLSRMISKRFGVTDIPDVFFYLPDTVGGLGLKNPFIPLALISDDICPDPVERMEEYHKEERQLYEEAKQSFECRTLPTSRASFRRAFNVSDENDDTGSLAWKDAQEFYSYEEMTRWRQYSSEALHDAHIYLLRKAGNDEVPLSARVKDALKELSTTHGLKEMYPDRISPEMRWILQLHSDELFEKYGGLSIVDKSLLPLGVLKAMSTRKVKWQMVL